MSSSHKNRPIVFITSRFPYPLEKGDKLRAYHQIKVLAKHFDVHLIALHEEWVGVKQYEALNPFCRSIHTFHLPKLYKWLSAAFQFFSNKPFQVGYFYNPFVHRKVKRLLTSLQPEHIYCQLIRATEYVKDYHECPKTLDYMDALSKGVERRIGDSGFLKNRLFKKEFQRLIEYENAIFEYFEYHTIISEEDKNHIFHKDLSKITVVKNGVDEQFFEKIDASLKHDLVFTGNMSYPPNIKACSYLVNEILPLCKHNLNVCLSGANPVGEVWSLQNDHITVTGWVDDIRTSYAQSKIFIAPMTIGTGLQNKLLEAMAMGLPCITTPLANKALGAKNGETILIGETPTEIAAHIDLLYENQKMRNQMGKAAQDFVRNNYDWLSVTKPLVDILSK